MIKTGCVNTFFTRFLLNIEHILTQKYVKQIFLIAKKIKYFPT